MRRGDDDNRRTGWGGAADARMGVCLCVHVCACVCCDGLGRVGFVRATVLGGMQHLLLVLSLVSDRLCFGLC